MSLHLLMKSMFISSTHSLVVDDFNSPDINCPLLSASVWFSTLLCELIFNMHLSQVVDCLTHVKGNILDPVITSSMDKISNQKIHRDQFLSSNHLTISLRSTLSCPVTLSIVPRHFKLLESRLCWHVSLLHGLGTLAIVSTSLMLK